MLVGMIQKKWGKTGDMTEDGIAARKGGKPDEKARETMDPLVFDMSNGIIFVSHVEKG